MPQHQQRIVKPSQLSPLLEQGEVSGQKRHEMKEVQPKGHGNGHHEHPNTAYIIFVDLINMLMTASEIALVLYLTIHHFKEAMGVIAVVMLAPILLNFVGVTYFFSDKRERLMFEKVGTSRITKDLFQVPVLGPVFTAIKVLLISSGLSKRSKVEYERFEASAVKMRQAQTFFSASPEAMVQLSVLLISREDGVTLNHILEALIVIISIFTLAESNVYALRSNYFRLFESYEDGDWEVHETFGKKCILFSHSFFSIGSRIAAAASLIAAVQCFTLRNESMRIHNRGMMMQMPMTPPLPPPRPKNQFGWDNPEDKFEPPPSPPMPMPDDTPQTLTEQLGFMIGLAFVVLILYHIIIYYIARSLRHCIMGKENPGACYESVNYGWRSTILHTGFQSKNIATQLWFYIENCIMFSLWWFSVQHYGDNRVKQNTQIPMTIIFFLFSVLSIFFLFAAVGANLHRLVSPFKDHNRRRESLPLPMPNPVK